MDKWPLKCELSIEVVDPIIQVPIKGSRSHLQISLNITKLGKDKKYTIMLMYYEIL